MALTAIICEKRDQALKVAQGLGLPTSGAPPFRGTWNGGKAVVCAARGHLFALAPPDHVIPELQWGSLDLLTPIPKRPPVLPREGATRAIRMAKESLRGADVAIIATDADREGERIGWQILEQAGHKGPVRRAWLAGGLDPASIRKAFEHLLPGEERAAWGKASEARDRSDWAWQFAVRGYTALGRAGVLGHELAQGRGRASVLSVGRVQTPTLALLVERERAIESFVPTPHWTLDALLEDGTVAHYRPLAPEDGLPSGVVADERSGKPLFIDETAARAFAKRVGPHLDVISNKESETSIAPPKLLNLTDACAALAKRTGLNASLAQTVFEDAYEQGFLSYPRTKRREIPKETWDEWPERFKAIRAFPPLAALADCAFERHRGGKAPVPAGVTDKPLEHHAIIPTLAEPPVDAVPKKAKGKSVKHGSEHLLAAWAIAAERLLLHALAPGRANKREVVLEGGGPCLMGHARSRWTATGVTVLEPGWTAWAPGKLTDRHATAMRSGQLAVESIDVKKAVTKPPPRWSDPDLIKIMEGAGRLVRDPDLRALLRDSDGIGTPATRSNVIETLVDRGYIERRRGKLHALPKGMALIDVVPKALKSLDTTALWERELAGICELRGAEADEARERFVSAQNQLLEALVKSLQAQKTDDMNQPRAADSPPSDKKLAFAQRLADEAEVELPEEAASSWKACNAFIDAHKGKGGGTSRKPSEKMLTFAQRVSKASGVELPKQALSDGAACSAFIDEHKGSAAGGMGPSEKMLAFAQRISKASGAALPKLALTDGEACGAFIDMHKGVLDGSPSEKMLEFAERIAAALGVEVPDEARTDSKACGAFIDANKAAFEEAPKAPSEKQLNLARRMAGALGELLPKAAETDARVCTQWIDARAAMYRRKSK